MRRPENILSLLGAWGVSIAMAGPAVAQGNDPTGAVAPEAADVTPPTLKTHAEATYPADALRDRIEGTVGLELDVDETGKVVDANVIAPAGHGFDEAAVAAARQFTFEPARKGGNAIRSTVQFTYEFHLPARPPPAQPRRGSGGAADCAHRCAAGPGAGRRQAPTSPRSCSRSARSARRRRSPCRTASFSSAPSAACRTSCASRPAS